MIEIERITSYRFCDNRRWCSSYHGSIGEGLGSGKENQNKKIKKQVISGLFFHDENYL